jgi:5'-nucleotidase/UDP-sugar diphosphatase
MEKNMKKLLLITMLVFSTIMFGYSASLYEDGRTYKITILHTNDHHGHFWPSRHGEYGFAAQKTLIDRIRKEVSLDGGYILVLSGGDINTGVPESDLQDAEPDFKAMSMIGYDAMVLGNHEFDKPNEVLAKQKEWAKFPFLAANIIKKSNGRPLYTPYITYSFDGLRVAIMGLTTGDTPKLVTPTNVEKLRFQDPIETAKKLLPKLKQKAGLIIALTHMGYYDYGLYGSNAPGDVTLAQEVDGIDVIIGGHSHTILDAVDIQGDTVIAHAGDWGKYVGRLDLEFLNGEITVKNHKIIPVNKKKKIKKDGESVRVFVEEEIPADIQLASFLADYQNKGSEELSQVIGSVDADFVGERGIVRAQETNLGNLIAKTQRVKVGADVAVMNSGGIRTSLKQGDITYKDVLKVQPFSNTICMVTLSGAELKQYLEVAANKKAGSGAFAQFDNAEIVMNGDKLESAKVGGMMVQDSGSYKLAINSFAAAGGDGYVKVTNHSTFVDSGYIDADVLKEYIQKNSPLSADQHAPTNDVTRK